MNDKLVEAWNSVVGTNDTVFHLGDFAFGNEEMVKAIRTRLNGLIILIRGNHDRSGISAIRCGMEPRTRMTLQRNTKTISLIHNPRKFNQEEIDSSDILLHGHLHGHPHYDGLPPTVVDKLFDVGVDSTRVLRPITFDEIFTRKQQRENSVSH